MRRITLLFVIAVFCAAAVVRAQTAPTVALSQDVKIVEHPLLSQELTKDRMLPGDKVCGCFLRTTLGGKLQEPGSISFRFMEETPRKRLRVEIIQPATMSVILDEKKDVPTAEKTETEDGEFVWVVRMNQKTYDAAADCSLPKPSPPDKEQKK